jgi:hypothetical protein
MKRYAAKLLFQWNAMPGGRASSRRVCEETIVNFRAASPRRAVAKAKSIGRQHSFRSGKIRFQFIGILQLMELGLESGPDEVWWELSFRSRPLERRARILPREKDLWVLATPSGSKRRRLTSA